MSDELLRAARLVLSDHEPHALALLQVAVLKHDVAEATAARATAEAESLALRACVAELQGQHGEAVESRRLLLLRIAELEAEAARRESFIVELEGRLADAQRGKPPAKAATIADACPHCGKGGFRTERARSMHALYCPQNPERKGGFDKRRPAPDLTAGVRVVAVSATDDSPDWRCPQRRSDAHARAIGDDVCVKCAERAKAAA